MFSMSIWALVTATITITSRTSKQIMVGRILNCTCASYSYIVSPSLNVPRRVEEDD